MPKLSDHSLSSPSPAMSSGRDLVVVGLGELLWDELPAGRRLGGAPANFAVMASRLGVHGVIASRLGPDEAGSAARALLADLPVDTRFLQQDPSHPTGQVSVTLRHGQPEYKIHAPVAWDALELTPAWQELALRADAVCWGTLAQRDTRSAGTLHAFLAATRPACLRIFDINLRAPFFTTEAVTRSLAQATLLKLNDSEMPPLLSFAGLQPATGTAPEALIRSAQGILTAYPGLRLVAITLGSDGSLLVSREQTIRHPGIRTQVADTVGAGDAFTAALAVYRLRGASFAVQSEAANRWGAWVAGQSGAMPELTDATRQAVERSIENTAIPK